MIDLHLHLDGSLSKEDFIYLSELANIKLEDNFMEKMQVHEGCQSLSEFLECFALPIKLTQSKEALTYAVKSLVNRLYNAGYIYIEIRFAPQLHTQNGLSQKEVVEAALLGLHQGLLNKPNFDANLILCMMRQTPLEVNLETVRVASEFKNDKVVAIDIAGPEKVTPIIAFKLAFDLAKELGVQYTIHAGEESPSKDVEDAISLGASRIGHGVHYDLNYLNIREALNKNICFEFCPTSNIETTSIKDYESLPLNKFLQYGLNVCINSDDMTVCGTDVLKEFRYLYKTYQLPIYVVQQLLLTAARYSFASAETKAMLTKLVNERIQSYYRMIITQ